ncbi:MAG: UvrD-helicase domain-containing protein [FCB group bacterium]|nr:UvrD-helicase domain-containing protein [FCB group bacterium]
MQRTTEQNRAIDTVGVNLCVDAAAGSGKTSVLVERIVSLIERRLADLDQIVAITFTDNAAAEMKERLRRECRKRAPQDNPQKMTFWRDIERRVEGARISTIHGFCSRLLRENALHLGLDPDFVVLPDAESRLMRGQAIATALHELLDEQDPVALQVASEYGVSRTQSTLREFLNRPALLEHVGRNFPMDNPEALRREWERLLEEYQRKRLQALVQSPELLQFRDALATFEGKCLKTADMRERIRVEMLLNLDAILAGADVREIEARLFALTDWKATGSQKKNWDAPETQEELGRIQKAVKEFAEDYLPKEIDPQREELGAELACGFFAVFNRVAEEHTRIKGDGNALDFDDLIHRALNTLRDNEAIRARTARGIRYLLIDEFQDTDAVQFELATLLTREEGGPELFIVGDAKQSIYYFRGADVEVFGDARGRSHEVVSLARNFRTVPEIVHFVNDLFDKSGLLRAVEIDYRGMEPHRDPCGQCRIEFLLPEATEEKLLRSAQRTREAELLAARLAQMCGGPAPVQICDKNTGDPRPANFGDVAILFRSLSNVYYYEHSLKRMGIPYTLVAGAGFYQRQEIVDLRNLLTLVRDPWNEMALLAFLRSPIVGLSDEALLRLRGTGEVRRGLAQVFNAGEFANDPDADYIEAARRLLADLRAHSELPLPELLRRTLDLTGYEAILLDQFLGTQKASNVRKLLDLALDFSRTRPPRLSDFLRYLDEVAAQEVREGEAALTAEGAGAVRIMTIHKAKGLEFPIVVVPDLTRKPRLGGSSPIVVDRELGLAARVPDDKGTLQSCALYEAMAELHKQRERDEEARVLYVAMTRARDYLLLGAAPEDKGITGSWFQTLLTQYDLLAKKHGQRFNGKGWEAVVLRTLDAQRLELAAEPQTDTPSRAILEARIAPIPPGPTDRRIFSVSEILNRFPIAEDAPHNGSAQRPRLIDPKTRGTLLHTLFQRWDLKAPLRPLAEAICRKDCPNIDLRGQVADDLVAVAERFRQTDLAQRLVQSTALQREEPFVLRVGENLVAGNVDAVLDDGTVIDYKTGEHTPAAQERYEWQVLLYALALQALRNTITPAAYLVYVDTGDVVQIEITPGRLQQAQLHAAQAITALRGT